MKAIKLLPLFFLLIFVSCSEEEAPSPVVGEYSLTTLARPAEGGTISPASGTFDDGAEVQLSAEAAAGYRFVSWAGDASGNDNPLSLLMGEDKAVTAVFEKEAESIVIFSINDPHGKINNFAKIKAVIDAEKEKESQVFFVSGGDIFSGNPIVDYHPEKGSPIVDLMGKAGMDVSVIGNHEFDYGQAILNNRMEQASFDFLLANVTDQGSEFNIPQGMISIEKDGFNIAFIGVVETGSHDHKPLSHPKNVLGLEFSEGVEAVAEYEAHPAVKEADLVVALTHYGEWGDRAILEQHDFVDLVIGGHNHAIYNKKIKGRYMVQSGSDLKFLTKLSLSVAEGEVTDYKYQLISLEEVEEADEALERDIAAYNNIPELFEEIGTSLRDHNGAETGCFYTDALRTMTGADIVFQNFGGIRATLDMGSITPFDIYTIDPFGNGLETYSMKVSELKAFLGSPDFSSMNYSGLEIQKRNGVVQVFDVDGAELGDDSTVIVGLNDYISSVNPAYFESPLKIFEKTTADYIVDYLEQYQSVIDYEGCSRGIY